MSLHLAYQTALNDFHRARRRANVQQMLGVLRGQPGLLSYEEVRRQLHAIEKPTTQLKDIPLDSIVGSVGRYEDFTRDFLPKKEIDKDRWARVKVVASSLVGFPPIDVYKIGDIYCNRTFKH